VLRFSFSVGIGLTWTFLPLFADADLHLSSSQIGLVISLNVLLSTILQTPMGMVADKTGKGRWVITGGMLTVLSLYLIPYARGFLALFLINLMLGAAGGLALPSLTAIEVEEGKRLGGIGSLVGVMVMCHSLGMFLGPLFGGVVADGIGVRSVFSGGATVAALGLTGFALFYLLRRG